MAIRPGNYTQALEKYLSSRDFKDSVYKNQYGNVVIVLYASASYAVKSTSSSESEPDAFIVLTLPTFTGSAGAFDAMFEMQKGRIAAELREALKQAIKENVAGS